MIPLQEVKMVPVQEVEMVPVHEVVPINDKGNVHDILPLHGVVPAQHIIDVHHGVPVQNIVPMQHIVPLHAGTEVKSEVAQVSRVPGISELVPEVNQTGTKLISQPQVIKGSVQQISQIPSKVIPGSEVLP